MLFKVRVYIKGSNHPKCKQLGNHKIDILQMQANWVSLEPQSPDDNGIFLPGNNVGKYSM